jgi:hypothetical protein
VGRASAYRYGLVLLLLLATFLFLVLAGGFTGRWVSIATVLLEGATLLAALSAANASRRLVRLAIIVIAAGLLSGTLAVAIGTDPRGPLFLLSTLLVGAAPIAIIRSILQRKVIDVRTVLGAICVYMLIGMLWALLYTAIGALDSRPFFAQIDEATTADFLYFSFVTQTTVGYGDLTAAEDLGRALAVLEALIGQLYLVTVVALLVGRLGPGRLEA